jgi:hypothetical protein
MGSVKNRAVTRTRCRIVICTIGALSAATTASAQDIILVGRDATARAGKWTIASDSGASTGSVIKHPDAGAPKITSPLASPVDYFELTFTALAGQPYRLWIRGRAQNDDYANDSVYAQFDGSVTAAGSPVYRIGTTSAADVNLEECSSCGLFGWMWQDNGYGRDVLGPTIYFAASGTQRLRVQTREDGISIDQMVLSPSTYLNAKPTGIVTATTTTLPAAPEVVLAGASASTRVGAWRVVSDSTAFGGSAIRHPDAGAAKIVTALASPANYFELTFEAVAGIPYHLWIHGKADNDYWANDSVFVQFSGSVTATGAETYRIGTTSAADVNLEECSGCGVYGWMWQDNGYGKNVLGPAIYFNATGVQRLRVQTREDGMTIDQVVLSPSAYLTTPPSNVLSAPAPAPAPQPQPAPAPGGLRYVHAGDDLQAALDQAQPGDTILLDAGAIFRGNFVLGVKSGTSYITIRSNTADNLLPPAGTRITPAAASLLAKIQSPNDNPALITAAGAHHWRVMLVEVGPTDLGVGEIVRVGEGWMAQSQLSQVPYEIEFDRVYIHGHRLYGQKRGIAMNGRAVTIRNCWISDIKAVGIDSQAIGGWNGPGPLLVENNYLEAAGENFLLGGADPAISGLVTEDVTVRRNLFSKPMSWRDPIIPTPQGVSLGAASGGLPAGTYAYRVVARRAVGGGVLGRSTATAEVSATVSTGGVRVTWTPVPDAEEYVVYGRGRYWVVNAPSFTDTGSGGSSGNAPGSPGDVWQVKNLFELKNTRRATIRNNIFENNWRAAQPGYAILFTVRNQDGSCTWCVVSDVSFEYNLIRNVAAGINILGYDSPNVSAQSFNFRIRHNLFLGVRTALGGNGWFLLMGQAPRDVIVDHNTVDHDGTTAVYAYGGTDVNPMAITGFQFTNNAVRHAAYGINGAYFSTGTTTLAAYFPGAIVTHNWMPGGTASRYPAGNLFSGSFDSGFVDVQHQDYRAAAGGPLVGAATDGTNIGADVVTLSSSLSGVLEGYPSAAPPPSQSAPTPTEPVSEPVPAPVPAAADDIVLLGAASGTRVGRWSIVTDATAAGGASIRNPDAGAPKIVTALANPSDYFELTFDAVAGVPYRLWLHGRAENDYWGNDSVFVQFSGSATSTGAQAYRIGTTSAAEVNLESCSGCGVSGWMWQDNGYGKDVLGPAIYFATTGRQTMRVQTREDGLSVDQIILSPSTYLATTPTATLPGQ